MKLELVFLNYFLWLVLQVFNSSNCLSSRTFIISAPTKNSITESSEKSSKIENDVQNNQTIQKYEDDISENYFFGTNYTIAGFVDDGFGMRSVFYQKKFFTLLIYSKIL